MREKHYIIAIVATMLGVAFAAFYFEARSCGGRPQIDDAEALRVAKRAFGSDPTFWRDKLGFETLKDFYKHLDDLPNCCEVIRKSYWGAPYWEATFQERRGDKVFVYALQIDHCGGKQNYGWTYGGAD
jgi:hypothetical protein